MFNPITLRQFAPVTQPSPEINFDTVESTICVKAPELIDICFFVRTQL